jgi:hypothetical protein
MLDAQTCKGVSSTLDLDKATAFDRLLVVERMGLSQVGKS